MQTNRKGVDFLYSRNVISREEWYVAKQFKSHILNSNEEKREELEDALGKLDYWLLELLLVREQTMGVAAQLMAQFVTWADTPSQPAALTAETIARTRVASILKRGLRKMKDNPGTKMQAVT